MARFFLSLSAPISHIASAHLFTQPLRSRTSIWFVRQYSVRIGGCVLCCGATSTQASGRDRELEQCQHCECAKTHSWLSWQIRIRGRFCHEQSLLHMAERIPEGTDEDNKRYPWRMPTLLESEPVTTPSPVGPISLWRAAMITKYDSRMIEFDRDGKNWTIMQRSKHYSVTRMFLRDQPQSVKFIFIVTEPPNVSTREVINISREFTEVTALSYGARAPIELVSRQGWLKHMKSNSTKPPPHALPTPRRVTGTLIVESDESGKEVDAKNVHDEVIVIEENRNNEASSSSSGNQVDVVDKNETSNQCDDTPVGRKLSLNCLWASRNNN